MNEDKSYPYWPRTDERTVIQEMLSNHNSSQWNECREFVKRLVEMKAKNIPKDHWEDIIQDSMIRLDKSLATFQYHCAIRTWIFGIVRSCIIDFYRKSKRTEQFMTTPDDPHEERESDNDFAMSTPYTVEDVCITHQELDGALMVLKEYVSVHANAIRNSRILNMVLFENRSLEEAAQAVGCSAPVVGYVVRSAQRYVREKLGYQR